MRKWTLRSRPHRGSLLSRPATHRECVGGAKTLGELEGHILPGLRSGVFFGSLRSGLRSRKVLTLRSVPRSRSIFSKLKTFRKKYKKINTLHSYILLTRKKRIAFKSSVFMEERKNHPKYISLPKKVFPQ